MKKLLLLFFLILFLFGCRSTNNLNFPPAQHFNTFNEAQWEIVSLKVINLTNQETEVRNFLKGYFNPYPVTTPLGLSNYIYASIKYKKDRIDEWQHPEETFLLKTGDCEDQAIALAAALLAERYDAYVVVGSTQGIYAVDHAWVYLRLGQKEYYLDPTSFTTSLNEVEISNFQHRFIPYVIFNDRLVFKNKAWQKNLYRELIIPKF